MTKGKINPAYINNLEELVNVDTNDFLEGISLIANKQWYSFSKTLQPINDSLKTVVSNINGVFVPLPKNATTSRDSSFTIDTTVQNVVINCNNPYSIYYLDLQNDINLSLINIKSYTPIYLVIKFNDYKINNLIELGRYETNFINLLKNYNDILVLEVLLIDVVNVNIIYYGDYIAYKNKKPLLQINPKNDIIYYNDKFNNIEYSLNNHSILNDRIIINNTLSIPFKPKFNLNSATTFQLYVDFVINSYSTTYIDIFSVWNSSNNIFRIRINQNSIRYEFRNFVYTFNLPSFVDGRRYLLEFFKQPFTQTDQGLSVRLLDRVTNNIITPMSITSPSTLPTTTTVNHLSYSNVPCEIRVNELYGLLWTTDNDQTFIANRNFNNYTINDLFYFSEVVKRDYIVNNNVRFLNRLSGDFIHEGNATLTGAISGNITYEQPTINQRGSYLEGSNQDDVFYVFNANDTIYGGLGNDTVYLQSGISNLSLNSVENVVEGDFGYVFGEINNNISFLTGNNDTLVSSGNDTLVAREPYDRNYNNFADISNCFINYSPSTALNLIGDFEISFYVKFLTENDKGCIISVWHPSSKQFIISFSEDFIQVQFRTANNLTINLDTNIRFLKEVLNTPIFFEFIRYGGIYLLLANGKIINYIVSADNTTNTSTANLTIGKINTYDSDIPSSNFSFNGLVSNIKICNKARNIVQHKTLLPTDTSPIAQLLYKFYITERELSSNRITNPSSNITGTYNNKPILNTDLTVSSNNLDFSYKNTTIETYVVIPTGNNYGTILLVPNILHFGINNNKLHINLLELNFELNSNNNVPLNQRVHLAYVRSGVNHYLFINGNIEASGIKSGKINTNTISGNIFIKRGVLSTDVAPTYPGKSNLLIDSIAVLPYAKYIDNFTPTIEI